MSAEATTYTPQAPPLDLSKWRNLPLILVVGGMVLAALASLAGDARVQRVGEWRERVERGVRYLIIAGREPGEVPVVFVV